MDWKPPTELRRIRTIDCHTAGEPFRVILDGFPDPPGETILERRRYLQQHHEAFRKALMWEPRGHPDMYGCLLTTPVDSQADLGVLFMHNEGYSTMCGHGIIGLVKVAVECGLVPATGDETSIAIETPAGLVRAIALMENGEVQRVRFVNVPSFVLFREAEVEVPTLGRLSYDVAFGGAFYAYVDAESAGVELDPEGYRQLIERGTAIKHAVMAAQPIEHPFEEELSFLYGTIFVGPARRRELHSRNVCIFADGQVDRCPTGTGVSGRLALHHARGEIAVGEWIEIESLLGTTFRGRILKTSSFGPYPAVVPEVEGAAHITGRHEFLIDPQDPLREGFLLR